MEACVQRIISYLLILQNLQSEMTLRNYKFVKVNITWFTSLLLLKGQQLAVGLQIYCSREIIFLQLSNFLQ